MRKPRVSEQEAPKRIPREVWIPDKRVLNREICYNAIKHMDRNCPGCFMYQHCICIIKDDYKKRHEKITERETTTTTSMTVEMPKKKPRKPELPKPIRHKRRPSLEEIASSKVTKRPR